MTVGRARTKRSEFHKVEQIVICDPADSEHWLDQCQRNAEDLLSNLALPYRVVRVCVGDLGAPAYKKYDTETWFPSFGAYRETHSNSNLTDYQARRFKIRSRGRAGPSSRTPSRPPASPTGPRWRSWRTTGQRRLRASGPPDWKTSTTLRLPGRSENVVCQHWDNLLLRHTLTMTVNHNRPTTHRTAPEVMERLWM